MQLVHCFWTVTPVTQTNNAAGGEGVQRNSGTFRLQGLQGMSSVMWTFMCGR